MQKIGITGRHGFIGKHLYNTIGLFPEIFQRIDFDRSTFDDSDKLDQFVGDCDVIVHLAAINRHEDAQYLYELNLELVNKLRNSLIRTQSKAHVILSSSSQEDKNNLYGMSKKEGRDLLTEWADKNESKFTGLIIPNVFGAFGKPFYNSFIATFCHQLTHGEIPTIAEDSEVKLIYVQELVEIIIDEIKNGESKPKLVVMPTTIKKVSEVLQILTDFKVQYFDAGVIPVLDTGFKHNLFNTYRSFIDHKNHYPIKFTEHKDPRGAFVEIIRLGIGGQCSFSTTVSGITRGNHYHTRKIERFAVIKGSAKIQMRKIDSQEILNFDLDGNEPAYVDMPIWFTHNIKNTGNEDLYTIFWINEAFKAEDSDTYFETV